MKSNGKCPDFMQIDMNDDIENIFIFFWNIEILYVTILFYII